MSDMAINAEINANVLFNEALKQERLRFIDVELAQLVKSMLPKAIPSGERLGLTIIVSLLSNQLTNQNVCLSLNRVQWQNPFYLNFASVEPQNTNDIQSLLAMVPVDNISAALTKYEPLMPIVYKNDLLFLTRYWNYESTIAEKILTLASTNSGISSAQIIASISQLFGEPNQAQINELDWQQVAVSIAAHKKFAVITGGPGTGKTTTVAKLLALLVETHVKSSPVIEIIAPTGKAAVRLSESIKAAKSRLSLSPQALKAIPDDAKTIHRLLGPNYLSPAFKHNSSNPIHADVVVVDEASMIDLSLMAKLIDALPDYVHLILLGDEDQLASVEAGNVLAEICKPLNKFTFGSHLSSTAQTWIKQSCHQDLDKINKLQSDEHAHVVSDCLVKLVKSHRFSADSGIGQLASAINNQNSGQLNQVISVVHQDLLLADLSASSLNQLIDNSARQYQPYLNAMHDKQSPKAILQYFNRYQVLAATKGGELGVNNLNHQIEERLIQGGYIKPTSTFYAGRPIMIQQNDYELQLFNGDIGIVLPDDTVEGSPLKAFFLSSDNNIMTCYPSRLPQHETVYAMTVHKSQGSEFDEVSLVTPTYEDAKNTPVLSKELIYTGITRAKAQLNLYSSLDVINLAMSRETKRQSGLATKLYQ